MPDKPRPQGITDEHLTFLDELRESGVVNMWGARPFIVEQFRVTQEEASAIHTYWMDTFGDPTR